ncbi:MAG: ribosome maturation factor RimM [Stigonema ocellatum SAG 48.90 = DSM 106950]|nr:ribosome maturation factor RimM [Stigonema ocellatum SAG 48.90 = DSM 106950]
MRNKKTTRQSDGKKPNSPLTNSPLPNPHSQTPPLTNSQTPHSPLPTPKTDEWLEVGTIVAPQGLHGELRVYPDTDFPERFEVPGKRWLLRPGKTEPQPIELLAGRYVEGKNLYVIKLAGVENCNQAEELRGCKVMVHQTDRPHQLGEDEYHVPDLIGMFVFMQESGELVGWVIDVIPAGNDLLEVQLHPTLAGDKGEKKVLIPFVKAIAPVVDLEAGRIEITPPLGLVNCY